MKYIHTPAYEGGTDREFRNVGSYNSDAGELPKKEQITKNSLVVKNLIRCSVIAFFYLCVPTRTEMLSYNVSRFLKLSNLKHTHPSLLSYCMGVNLGLSH